MSASNYAQRYEVVATLGRKINILLNLGYLVLDKDNDVVEEVYVEAQQDGAVVVTYHAKASQMSTRLDADNLVAEFFDHWKVVHPNNIVKLTEAP